MNPSHKLAFLIVACSLAGLSGAADIKIGVAEEVRGLTMALDLTKREPTGEGPGTVTAAAGLFLGGLTYASALSAPFTGSLVDRLGQRRVLIITSLIIVGCGLSVLGIFGVFGVFSIGIVVAVLFYRRRLLVRPS